MKFDMYWFKDKPETVEVVREYAGTTYERHIAIDIMESRVKSSFVNFRWVDAGDDSLENEILLVEFETGIALGCIMNIPTKPKDLGWVFCPHDDICGGTLGMRIVTIGDKMYTENYCENPEHNPYRVYTEMPILWLE